MSSNDRKPACVNPQGRCQWDGHHVPPCPLAGAPVAGSVAAEAEALRAERDHLDAMQAAFRIGIGLARLELSGVNPDHALAMQRLNRAVEESDRLRAEWWAKQHGE